jgi:hypothetical protein
VRAGGVGVDGLPGLAVGATVVGVQVSPPLSSSVLSSSSGSIPGIQSASSSSSPPLPGKKSTMPLLPQSLPRGQGVGATVVATHVSPPLPGAEVGGVLPLPLVLLPRIDLVRTATRSSAAASAKGGGSPPVSSGGATSARVDLKEVTMTLCAVNLNALRSPYAKKSIGIRLSVSPTFRPRIPETHTLSILGSHTVEQFYGEQID